MKPGNLPFEYPFRWRNEDLTEMAGVTPEAAALLEQRDRDLEDFLSTLGGGGGGIPTVFVAASDASDLSKALATYTCDGTADEEEIDAALLDCRSLTHGRGRVVLSEGTFTLSRTGIGSGAGLSFAASKVLLQGLGRDSTLINHTGTAKNGYIVYTEGADFHLADLTVDGSGITDGGYGVYLDGNHCSVQRVRFQDVGYQSSGNLRVQGGACRVQDCEFYRGVGSAAIDIAGNNTIVTGNYFENIPTYAVLGPSHYYTMVCNNQIINAQVDGGGITTDVIYVFEYAVVTSNVCQGSVAAATIASGIGSQVANNVLL